MERKVRKSAKKRVNSTAATDEAEAEPAAESSPNAAPAERDVFAAETESELDALIEGRYEEESLEEAQPEQEEESSRQQELSTEAALKQERRERLKRARDIRFRTGESETSIPRTIDRQLQQEISLENNLGKRSISSTRVPRNADSADEIEVDLLLNEDFDDDDDDEDEKIVQQPLRGTDPIKAKMEFLQFFEIPSLSDISEDCDDAADAVTARPIRSAEYCQEELEAEEVEEEEEQAAIRSIAGGDSIRAKMQFLNHFAIPSLSDMSED